MCDPFQGCRDPQIDEISSLRKKLAEALLDAERAREERNREHVRLNAEWMAKCEELRKAQAFAGIVLGTYRAELGDLDGFWLQEQAQAHAMIEEREAVERCGENCVCAEVVTSFPTSCFFITDAGKAAIEAAAMAKKEGS
jgi:hypothetical protein